MQHVILDIMLHITMSGLELELYAPHELVYVYWMAASIAHEQGSVLTSLSDDVKSRRNAAGVDGQSWSGQPRSCDADSLLAQMRELPSMPRSTTCGASLRRRRPSAKLLSRLCLWVGPCQRPLARADITLCSYT